jgi:hypothetical protein
MPEKKRKEKNYAPWLLVLLLALPLILKNLVLSYDFQLVVHYLLYLIGFMLAAYLILKRVAATDSPSYVLFQFIIMITVFWDFSLPIYGVPAFSLLKLLFYTLVIAKLSKSIFVSSSFFRFDTDVHPLTLLTILIGYNYYLSTFSSLRSLDFANIPLILAFVSPPFFSLVMLILMSIVSVRYSISSVREPERFRALTPLFLSLLLFFGGGFVLYTQIVHFVNMDASTTLYNEYDDVFSSYSYHGIVFILLFFYSLVFSLYDEAKFKLEVCLLFCLSFLIIYIGNDIMDIVKGYQELFEFQQSLSIAWKVFEGIAVVFGFIGSLAQLLERKDSVIANR